MLRSVLLGLLAFSTASACKGTSDAPAVQPGVTAGKVVELTGEVTATRGSDRRVLASGQEVSGDDVIETAGGARVAILLAHNHVRWDLGPNRKEKVGDSLAWKQAKHEGPVATSDEATLAAGRHAERQTANTTATTESARGPAADPAPPSAAPPAAASAVPEASSHTPSAVPPPPPPPPPPSRPLADVAPSDGQAEQRRPKRAAPTDKGGGGVASESDKRKQSTAPSAPSVPVARSADEDAMIEPATADPAAALRAQLHNKRAALTACANGTAITLGVSVRKGTITFAFAPGVPESVRTCFTAIAQKLTFSADYTATTTYVVK